MPKRTYELEQKVVEWIDEFSDENDESKSVVVNRAIKVYAAKLQSGEIRDPRFQDEIDMQFSRGGHSD